ncbi:hypothetical protein SUDANB121_03052 [Nocardiopsis dassonvillei]|uniref:hypothetical protein n=1 Tax=Nocardiopsis dassonvillei TaxID=2014 RepID=UPI003F543242
MFTAHGSASASGARTAVCPAPVRRALLLAALVAGVLCALWLAGASPATAAEGQGDPGTGTALPAGPLDRHRPVVADIGGPLADTVAGVGTVGTMGTGVDNARRVLEEPIAPQASADPQEMARDLDEAVRHVVAAPVAEAASLPEAARTTAPEPGTAVERGHRAPRPEPAPAVPATEPVAVHASVTESAAAEPAAAEDSATGADRTPDNDAAVAAAPLGSGTTTSAPTAPSGGAAQGGGLIAGHLPAFGAPAPAPGLVQAARHVLRSVPAEEADEPTFSPD